MRLFATSPYGRHRGREARLPGLLAEATLDVLLSVGEGCRAVTNPHSDRGMFDTRGERAQTEPRDVYGVAKIGVTGGGCKW